MNTSPRSPNDLFEIVALTTLERFGPGYKADGNKASLIAGSIAARKLVAGDPALQELWGLGDLIKATNLVEVWTSIVALNLYQNYADRESTIAAVLAALFGSNERTLLIALQACERERTQHSSDGAGLFEYVLIYLRTVGALGGRALDFEAFETPIQSMGALVDRKIVDPRWVSNFDSIMRIVPIVAEASTIAVDSFNELSS